MTPTDTPGARFQPGPVDARRAAAFIVHAGRRDVAGCNAILSQVAQDNDPSGASTRLLFAVVETYQQTVPLLHTPTGLAWLSSVVVDLAGMDGS